MRITSVGHGVFAAAMIGLGILGLVTGTFPPIWSGVPQTFPAREAIAYLCALVALGSGIGLLFDRTALAASRVLAAYLVLWFVAVRIPFLIQHPTATGPWWACGATAIMLGSAWMLFATDDRGLRIARTLYGLGMIPLGVAHFTYLERTASMVPSWLPWHTAVAYFTGAAFIAGGLAIVAGIYARAAAILLTVQIVGFTVFVWIPIIVGHPTASDWNEFVESLTLIAAAWVVADSFRAARSRAPVEGAALAVG